MTYNRQTMRSVVVQLEEDQFARLERAAARRGRAPEEVASDLLVDALPDAEAVGSDVLEELRGRAEQPAEEEALAIAASERAAMRAERRARRP